MIYELNITDFIKIKPLLKDLEKHPVINGVIDGNNLGRIFVDDLTQPTVALVWAKMEMFYLIGDSQNDTFIANLESFIIHTIKPEALAMGETDFNLEVFPFKDWVGTLKRYFAVSLNEGERVPFVCEKMRFLEYLQKPFEIADGYHIHRIDPRMICLDKDHVIEKETLKFWESFDKFYKLGLGYCVTKDNTIMGTCISVFVTGKEVEIGINTYGTEHRGKGLATTMAREFIRKCIETERNPHWTTEEFRKDSVAIARKLGFRQLPNYKVFYIPFEDWNE